MNIINERPEGMSFEDYKTQLKLQKDQIKKYKQGKFYYVVSDVTYVPEDTKRQFGYVTRKPSFVGKTEDLVNPIWDETN